MRARSPKSHQPRRLGAGSGCAALVGMVALLGIVAAVRADEAPKQVPAAFTPEQFRERIKFFEANVRPVLAGQCFQCHGEKKHKGDLRLDSREAVLKGGKHGPAVVPGKPGESLLVKAISYQDKDLQMPPEDHPLAAEQVEALTNWVQMGAPWPTGPAPAKVAQASGRGKKISDQDRAFWSFQPVKDPPVASVRDERWSKNAIDRFVLAKLEAEGLTPAAEADRVSLIRRVTFDLHGLPPTPAEVQAFIADSSRNAYEKLIDRLLASPRYGEHWARHWLDLVRYAESDGFKQDAYRPNAWPYRDYVIKSFNDDKPYDRFVMEQLAGDELAPDDPNVVVATGYLRHGIYEYNQADVRKQWEDLVNEVTDVTGDVFLGLSMQCARCHDHKFDPILQADYFKLRSFFAPMLPRNDLPLATPQQRAEYERKLAVWEEKTKDLREQIAAIEKPFFDKQAEGAIDKFPLDMRAVMHKPADQRTVYEEQIYQLGYRQVAEKTEKLDLKLKPAEKDRYDALRKKLAEFEAIKPKPLQTGFIATDVGPVAPPTVIPGRDVTVEPGYLTVLETQPLAVPPIESHSVSTGRRTALAKWITRPEHPLTARVMVNRIWQYHFGRGLVGTSSDYGTLGERPSHPELLDYLASRFVDNGWSIKSIHRLILLSATYRQSALRAAPPAAKLKDPDNRWLWRQNTRRLDAEQIRDAMLAVSGELKPEAGGPSADTTSPRRAVYTKMVRNNRDPLLDAFDLPDAFGSAPNRNTTTTATQSLLMINGQWPLQRAAAFAARVQNEANTADNGKVVETAFRLAYGRAPTPEEREVAVAFLNRAPARNPVAVADAKMQNEPTPAPAASSGNGGGAAAAALVAALERPLTKTMPHLGGQALYVRNGNPDDLLRLPDNPALPGNGDFTVEAYVLLDSIYDDATVRVIASQWDGDKSHPGWSFGVTSAKSQHGPRNLILQLVGDQGYEVLPSDLRLELNRTYYVAVSVKLKDTSEKGVTFYVKDITDMDAMLRAASVKHQTTGGYDSPADLILGGRAGTAVHAWDGLIDEVRLSTRALASEELLYSSGHPKDKEMLAADWMFEEQPGFFEDSAGRQKDLARGVALAVANAEKKKDGAKLAPLPNVDPALLDLCHALLNSNEFLYVD
jgi:hypothetical protein